MEAYFRKKIKKLFKRKHHGHQEVGAQMKIKRCLITLCQGMDKILKGILTS